MTECVEMDFAIPVIYCQSGKSFHAFTETNSSCISATLWDTILLLVLGCLLSMFNKLSLADMNCAFPFFDALIVVFFLFGAPRNNEFAHIL
jgi:hypothetical protein